MNAHYALIYSIRDLAGKGIAGKLKEILDWKPCSINWNGAECWYSDKYDTILAGFKEDTIYMEFLDTLFDVNAYIFLARHSSSSRTPTLSIHHTGNPTSSADYGGRPRELSWVLPRLSKTLFQSYYNEALDRELLEKYSFTLEATHHGPTSLSKPLVFIEIGSSEKQWTDKKAQEAAAAAVAKTIEAKKLKDCKPVIGVGGTHYPEKHTKLMLEEDYCYGHIFARYVLKEFDENILDQAYRKSLDKVHAIIVLKVPSKAKRIAENYARERKIDIMVYK